MNQAEIENAVAGSVLRDERVLGEALALGLEGRHFTQELPRGVYEAALEGWRKDHRVDLFTVVNRLGRENADVVSRLRQNAPLTLNTSVLIQSILDNAVGEELSVKLQDLQRRVQSRKSLERLDPIIDELGSLLTFAKGSGHALTTSSLRDSVSKFLEDTEGRIVRASSGKLPGIPSGFPRLDEHTYGFQKGWMYVLGARTGVGKTTMATTMAVNAAEAGHKVGIVTVEMSDSDLAGKILSRASKVPLANLMLGNVDDAAIDKLAIGAKAVCDLPVFITSVKKPQLDHLTSELTRLVKISGVEFVVIDYLQQFETGEEVRRRMTARDTAKGVSVSIQSLAKQLNIPILVLSQLNREAPEEGAPDLKHIAETDQIARDADVVMFLYRLDGRHYLSLAKQRRGRTGVLKLKASLDISHFEQAATDGTR